MGRYFIAYFIKCAAILFSAVLNASFSWLLRCPKKQFLYNNDRYITNGHILPWRPVEYCNPTFPNLCDCLLQLCQSRLVQELQSVWCYRMHQRCVRAILDWFTFKYWKPWILFLTKVNEKIVETTKPKFTGKWILTMYQNPVLIGIKWQKTRASQQYLISLIFLWSSPNLNSNEKLAAIFICTVHSNRIWQIMHNIIKDIVPA